MMSSLRPGSDPVRLVFGVLLAMLIQAMPTQAAVMLAGGHLPVCSSLSPGECAGAQEWPEQALEAHRYRIDAEALQRWADAAAVSDEGELNGSWQQLLLHLRDDEGPWLARAELTRRIREASLPFPDDTDRPDISGEALYQAADDRQWMRILDHLQKPTAGRREVVRLQASRNADSIAVFERFVTMAAAVSDHERPLIAVSTASSRDPFDALDFYLQVFEQAGADVVWLPLDAAVRQARAAGRCDALAVYQARELGSHDRERVWPDTFGQQLSFCRDADAGLRLVEQIDGLFINGGDQWLTLHAFRDFDGHPTPELARILARLEAGELVLGGTSAGAAVQSGPAMVSNGSNRAAQLAGAIAAAPPAAGCERSGRCPTGLNGDSLTYHPPGGLGSLAFAIVDTHFSERQRQLRLSQLLRDSGHRFGLGIDETSALLIQARSENRFRLEVLGASAGWLMDRPTEGVPQLHRLSPGHVLELDLDSLPLPTAAEPTGDMVCEDFDWSASFNDLLVSQDRSSVSCWRLEPAPGRSFKLELRVHPQKTAGLESFDFILREAD